MSLGLVGKKCGMTRIFTQEGVSVPVTVLEVVPNRVTQVKTVANEGYDAVQVTAGTKRASRINKAQTGHFAKAGVEPGVLLKEFRLGQASQLTLGDQLDVDLFTEGQKVDVQATSKGKGFAGVIKRHNFGAQNMTHGNSLSHRAPGSTGQCQTPGRVFKGKKLPGQMGNVTRSVQSQEVVKVDKDKHLILVKGNIPGAPGGMVVITHAVKAKQNKEG